jgi:hypothetical protein
MVTDLEKMNSNSSEVEQIRSLIANKTLSCSNIVDVNGDTRFWNVDPNAFKLFGDFKDLAEREVEMQIGKAFNHTILMVNHITPQASPEGSGGGWHVDSVQDQYKLFMYLTNCESESQGPLTLFTSGSKIKDRMRIIINYLKGNKFRFSNSVIDKLESKGFAQVPVLRESLKPFFVNTSFIHRGARITVDERMLITAYMFDKIPSSIQKRLLP